MSRLPKLKLKDSPGYWSKEKRNLEQAKDFFNFNPPYLVIVDGQVVISYEELVQLAAQERYKDKEFLEVEVLPIQGGG